jgi:ABC-type uncharacterized transport system auxiliary subunit
MKVPKRVLLNTIRSLFLILSIFLLQAGCALTTKDAITYHTFNYPSPPAEKTGVSSDTLMVYHFLLDPDIEMHTLAVSCEQGSEKSILKHRWQENPADMITELVLRDLKTSGLFARTVDQLSTARYRYALEGLVRQLQGEIKNGKAFAQLTIDASLMDFDAPLGMDKSLMRQTYRFEVPSVDSKPESIVAALNQGLKDFSTRLRNDIRAALDRESAKSKK